MVLISPSVCIWDWLTISSRFNLFINLVTVLILGVSTDTPAKRVLYQFM
jgi:hypothetical protein